MDTVGRSQSHEMIPLAERSGGPSQLRTGNGTVGASSRSRTEDQGAHFEQQFVAEGASRKPSHEQEATPRPGSAGGTAHPAAPGGHAAPAGTSGGSVRPDLQHTLQAATASNTQPMVPSAAGTPAAGAHAAGKQAVGEQAVGEQAAGVSTAGRHAAGGHGPGGTVAGGQVPGRPVAGGHAAGGPASAQRAGSEHAPSEHAPSEHAPSTHASSESDDPLAFLTNRPVTVQESRAAANEAVAVMVPHHLDGLKELQAMNDAQASALAAAGQQRETAPSNAWYSSLFSAAPIPTELRQQNGRSLSRAATDYDHAEIKLGQTSHAALHDWKQGLQAEPVDVDKVKGAVDQMNAAVSDYRADTGKPNKLAGQVAAGEATLHIRQQALYLDKLGLGLSGVDTAASLATGTTGLALTAQRPPV